MKLFGYILGLMLLIAAFPHLFRLIDCSWKEQGVKTTWACFQGRVCK